MPEPKSKDEKDYPIVAYGEWTRARPRRGRRTHYTGTCQKCERVVPAVSLELRRLPFGRGEQWQCRGGC